MLPSCAVPLPSSGPSSCWTWASPRPTSSSTSSSTTSSGSPAVLAQLSQIASRPSLRGYRRCLSSSSCSQAPRLHKREHLGLASSSWSRASGGLIGSLPCEAAVTASPRAPVLPPPGPEAASSPQAPAPRPPQQPLPGPTNYCSPEAATATFCLTKPSPRAAAAPRRRLPLLLLSLTLSLTSLPAAVGDRDGVHARRTQHRALAQELAPDPQLDSSKSWEHRHDLPTDPEIDSSKSRKHSHDLPSDSEIDSSNSWEHIQTNSEESLEHIQGHSPGPNIYSKESWEVGAAMVELRSEERLRHEASPAPSASSELNDTSNSLVPPLNGASNPLVSHLDQTSNSGSVPSSKGSSKERPKATQVSNAQEDRPSWAKLGPRPTATSELELGAGVQLESKLSSNSNSGSRVSSQLSRSTAASSSSSSSKMMGLGLGKEFMKILAMCAIFAIAFKMITSFLRTKQADVRRCKPIGRFLMWCGWDEFETFEIFVTVHSVGDIQKDGMMGSKEFKIVVNFNWSKFETVPTKDCKWEQTKSLVVPQGATECNVALYSLGTIKDSKVGGFTIETKDGMLDAKKFWNEKKKFKIEYKGKQVGTLSMTFRKRGDGEDGMPELPIDGIDDESGLAIEVLKEWEDLCNTPGYVKPESGKLEGEDAIYLLSKVLTDDLREIDPKGKELGKVYIRVVNCNYADLQGDDRNEALQKQMEKARKKGLTELERKWYWCWYEDKKAAESKWTHPDGFIPMACITAVCRTPGRSDEFLIKHSQGDPLRYRRESGKGLDTWVDGIEIVFNVCRNAVKGKKEQEEKEEAALQRMTMMHQQWLQTKGQPQSTEEWKEWKAYFQQNNYDDELITKFYQQMVAAQKKAAGGGGGGRRGR